LLFYLIQSVVSLFKSDIFVSIFSDKLTSGISRISVIRVKLFFFYDFPYFSIIMEPLDKFTLKTFLFYSLDFSWLLCSVNSFLLSSKNYLLEWKLCEYIFSSSINSFLSSSERVSCLALKRFLKLFLLLLSSPFSKLSFQSGTSFLMIWFYLTILYEFFSSVFS